MSRNLSISMIQCNTCLFFFSFDTSNIKNISDLRSFQKKIKTKQQGVCLCPACHADPLMLQVKVAAINLTRCYDKRGRGSWLVKVRLQNLNWLRGWIKSERIGCRDKVRTTRLNSIRTLRWRLTGVMECCAAYDRGGYVTCPSFTLRREKPLRWSIRPWYQFSCFPVSWGRVLIGWQVVNKDAVVS